MLPELELKRVRRVLTPEEADRKRFRDKQTAKVRRDKVKAAKEAREEVARAVQKESEGCVYSLLIDI
jgi:NAD(P)H-hydrate repair Nnr-like enzyme with NAD(P)H-hydrate dehydratase domain